MVLKSVKSSYPGSSTHGNSITTNNAVTINNHAMTDMISHCIRHPIKNKGPRLIMSPVFSIRALIAMRELGPYKKENRDKIRFMPRE